MAGTGAILERHGRRYGVSPFFMVAVAATESSIGEAACSNNRYNVWGLASCVNSWHVPSFSSWDEAIAFYARFLSDRWPTHSTPYSFRGYAACSECWARKVSEWMGRLFGEPARTRYP
jgi:flagellum-specific peptidoglycan hydrolase FlgJ